MEMKDKRLHDINVRIKSLKGKELIKEDYDIYCFVCGKKITFCDRLFNMEHSICGWSHRNCDKSGIGRGKR
jgi:uncharacterized UBP type Zn finger protein